MMDRRTFGLLAGLFAAGTAVGVSGNNNPLWQTTYPIAQERLKQEDRRELRHLVEKLYPEFIRLSYEAHIHSSKNDEEVYKRHDHPKNLSSDPKKLNELLFEKRKELRQFNMEFVDEIDLFGGYDKLKKDMEKLGYVLKRTPSQTNSKVTSYFLGRIERNFHMLNTDFGKRDMHKVTLYRQIVDDFDKYIDRSFIGQNLKGDVLINLAGIDERAKEKYALGLGLAGRDINTLDFRQQMAVKIVKEYGIVGEYKKNLINTALYHELNHDYGNRSEVEPYLGELIYGCPWDVMMRMDIHANNGSYKGKAASFIFKELEKKGISRDNLNTLSTNKIRNVVRNIHAR
ncbi:hypothetical protein ACFL6I_24140 [candidate division KSB1 bacterium]